MSSRGEDEWLPRPAVSGPVTWQDFTGKGGEPPSEGREVGEQWEDEDMSRNVRDSLRPYWVEGYYGKGGRKGTRANPNRGRCGELEGDLAIATVHADETGRDLEIRTLEEREDIGAINDGWNG